ncbi:protein tipE isoform X2 [Contarinia nasturtii]|uniref:protein tipE isoform X2 n=1 Tax=Contarinia nasturtii TaxID=265458 RepID=UPI0012D41A92|nr:protein tipE isoform X2 [Contarinia nasturtii]
MTGSERTTISASMSHGMSGAPSLVNSLNSYSSNTKLNGSQGIKSPEPEPNFIDNFLEKAKFYTSLCLGTSAILSVFAFLFLIPIFIEPSISTIIADYDQIPVTCMVVDHKFSTGMRNCTWSSCREGCTTATIRCHKLLVNYSKIPFYEWQKNPPPDLEKFEWDVSETRLLINSEGCGYPPGVNCTEFAKKYGYQHVGEQFPCYYSRAYPEIVITRYSWEDNLKYLILSLIIPNVIFALSIGVLSYWYCPCCDKACRKTTRVYTEKYPNKEEKLLCRSDEEDDDDDDMEF